MKIIISNFGPVRGKQEAVVDLSKGMTLVTGANGLGKTYFGYLVYGLLKRLNNPVVDLSVNYLFECTQEFEGNNSNSFIVHLSEESFGKYLEVLISSYTSQLYKYLGLERKKAEQIFRDVSIRIVDENELFRKFCKSSFKATLTSQDGIKYRVESEKESQVFKVVVPENALDTKLVPNSLILAKVFDRSILDDVQISRVFYFPVERIALYTFVNELSSKRSEKLEMVRSLLMEEGNGISDMSEYLRKNVNRYPEAISDALSQAGDLSQTTKNEASPEFVELALEIEREVLKGSILISQNGEVEFSPEKGSRKQIPVHLSASFIKAISGIILFLKHTATKGDMFMIDEPEMNLHPNMQVLLMRILARVANAGVKIWMSTHSDYMLTEFNNLCLAGTLFDKKQFDVAANLGYTEPQLIHKQNVQAFYLNPARTATQVKIDTLEVKDNGVDIESIDSCINELNRRSNELQEFYDNIDLYGHE